MVARGTRVGQAYIAITADGSGINDDIAAGFDDVDFTRLEEKFDKDFASRIKEHLNGFDKDFQGVLDRMEKSIEGRTSISDHIRSQLSSAFDMGYLDNLIEHVGRESGVDFGNGFDEESRRIITKSVLDSMEEALHKAGKSSNLDFRNLISGIGGDRGFDILGDFADKAVADTKRALGDARTEYEKFWADSLRAQDKANAAASKADDAMWAVRNAGAKAHAQFQLQYEKDWVAAHRENNRRIAAMDDAMWKVRNASAKAHATYLLQLERGSIDEMGNTLRRGQNEDTATRIGRMFGKGSRNNFFNILGSSMAGVIRLSDKVVVGVKKIASAGSKMGEIFMEGFGQASEGAGLLEKAMAGLSQVGMAGVSRIGPMLAALGEGLSAAAVAFPVLLVVVAAVVTALSLLASVIGALIGLVTALAAAIAGALAGALAVGTAGIMAMVAAGGLLVNAFMSMTDAQKEAMKVTFEPLHETLTGIGQLMITKMIPYFSAWASYLNTALAQLIPLADQMGAAFGRAGVILTQAMSGAGVGQFIDMLKNELPTITLNMSYAFGQFMNGLAGMFSAILPYVTQFSYVLSDIATRFANWASSAQGQNAITGFVDRALASLTSLWNFAKQFFGFISDLLFNPTTLAAGNSIFDSMARTFESFRAKVQAAAANGDLQRWLQDAIEFGGQLWGVIESLGGAFMDLYNSGALDAVGSALEGIGTTIDILGPIVAFLCDLIGGALAGAITTVLGPLQLMDKTLGAIGDAVGWAAKQLGIGGDSASDLGNQAQTATGQIDWLSAAMYDIPNITRTITIVTREVKQLVTASGGLLGPVVTPFAAQVAAPTPVTKVQHTGANALQHTSPSSGGHGPSGGGGGKDDWKNPYVAFAHSLMNNGPTIVQQIRKALVDLNKKIGDAIKEATKASSAGDVRSSIDSMIGDMKDSALSSVKLARDALNSAAQDLANADSPAEAQKALKRVRRAQKDLAIALRDQRRINNAAKILAAQKITDPGRVNLLLHGVKVVNATLADYANARARVATMLDAANQKLADAIALRDDYRRQVTDSVKAFGDLTTAVAQSVDGVEQALTAGDITSNLQTRLDKIKHFQDDLRQLLAMGLSNDAYKQIVDQGVDAGTAFADALLSGGIGSVQQTNSLVSQINGIADSLGVETSNRLYQAGVDAAKGLVDGLTSLSAQLDSAAAALGTSIANAVKKALGIKSPSRVLYDMMGYVGDGTVDGLDAQHNKVSAAAERFARQIAVSPEVAAYSSRQSQGAPVSGNSGNEIHMTVVTPTTDPKAVAIEAVNELTGRL